MIHTFQQLKITSKFFMYIFYTQLTTYRKYFSLSNRPDMTFAVDCSLKTKLLSIYLVQKAEEDIRGNLFEQHPQRYCLEEDEEEPDRDRGRDFSRTFSDLIQDASAHVHNTRPTTVTDFRVVCYTANTTVWIRFSTLHAPLMTER